MERATGERKEKICSSLGAEDMPNHNMKELLEGTIDFWVENTDVLVRLFENKKPIVRSVADACFGFIVGYYKAVIDETCELQLGRLANEEEQEEINNLLIERQEEVMSKILAAI
jgi:hypothetical protein